LIRTMEIVLFAGFFVHIIQAYLLTAQNRKARPIGYAVSNPSANSKWYSRSMTLLGTLILLFLVMHISHFWAPSRLGGNLGIEHLNEVNLGDKEVLNLFEEMVITFQSPFVLVVYLLGVISLCWHLVHGFQSAFQTLGVNHKKYTPVLKNIGICFSIVVCIVFAMMPISIFAGWIA
jgi:succinate dehydrogenase / fumarate reductase, cytochrome b subunit